MKQVRKISLALVMLLLLGVVFGGCGNSNSNKQTESTTSVASVASVAQTTQKSAEEKVNLVWYLMGSKPKNADSVTAKANELIGEKINANVKFNFVEPGDFNNKMAIIMGAGEVFDLCFTCNWANPYEQNVLKGAYSPLEELLEKFPEVKGLVNSAIWDGTKVNGKIYGVPNLQLMYDQPGVWMRKDLVEKYDIDVDLIKRNSDLTAVYQKIKNNEPNIIPVAAGFGDFSVFRSNVIGDIYIDINVWKIVDLQQENYNNWKLMREWNQKGFFPSDIATLKDTTPLLKAGKIFSAYSRQAPGGDASIKAKYGYDVVMVPLGPRTISKSSIQSTLTAISATSKNPEKAMALISMMANDKELFRTLAFGLENQDYKKLSDTRIEPISGAYAMDGWSIGNTFNGYLLPGNDENLFTQTKRYNDLANVDPAAQFSFDSSALTTEIAQMSAVFNEYTKPLKNGIDDVDKLMNARSDKMKQAGMDKIMAEAQRQLNAWRKSINN